MKIAVIDGQGGGIGKMLIEKLKPVLEGKGTIIALGTNALATAQMLKAGADDGATGENAIVYNASKVDLILGPMGIVLANAMLGELTPKMAQAIGESPAKKILIPVNKCAVHVVGVTEMTMNQYVEEAISIVIDRLTN
jgi:NAD(P)-dependent dehydrogenase (short-subunit alcohol dehydrogenase family)